jgi:hypothetical protein
MSPGALSFFVLDRWQFIWVLIRARIVIISNLTIIANAVAQRYEQILRHKKGNQTTKSKKNIERRVTEDPPPQLTIVANLYILNLDSSPPPPSPALSLSLS